MLQRSIHKQAIQENSLQAWLVCSVVCLSFLAAFFQLSMLSTIGYWYEQAFKLTNAQLGWFSSLYLFGLALSFIPAGLLLDRYQPRRILLIAMSLNIVGLILFSQTDVITIASVGRFFSGISHAVIFLTALRYISVLLPKKNALAVGCLVTTGMLGGMLAQTPLLHAITRLGWHYTSFIIIATIASLLIAQYLLLPHQIKQVAPQQKITMRVFSQVLRLPKNWYTAFYAGLLNIPILVLAALWGKTLLVMQYHISQFAAGSVMAMIYVGMMLGSPVWGFLSDYWQQRQLPMLCGAICAFVLVLSLLFIPPGAKTSLFVLFFSLGFMAASQNLAYPLISESNPPATTGLALGIANIIIMGTGAVCQIIFGYIHDTAFAPSHAINMYLLLLLISLSVICAIRINKC